MWEDLLKVQVSVARQKLRTDDEPLPDNEDEDDCLERIIDYIDKFAMWKPKLEWELVNGSEEELNYIEENLVSELGVRGNASTFYAYIEFGNPIIFDYMGHYHHGIRLNIYDRSLKDLLFEEACLVLAELENWVSKINTSHEQLDKIIEGTPYTVTHSSKYRARLRNNGDMLQPMKTSRFVVFKTNTREIILGFNIDILDFHLPFKNATEPMKYKSNFREIKLGDWL
tara:strand:- start:783 stop:1463 length:681 start_codon:yes stop_codon:yes gene_type:complete